jgi:hypothetical protein
MNRSLGKPGASCTDTLPLFAPQLGQVRPVTGSSPFTPTKNYLSDLNILNLRGSEICDDWPQHYLIVGTPARSNRKFDFILTPL